MSNFQTATTNAAAIEAENLRKAQQRLEAAQSNLSQHDQHDNDYLQKQVTFDAADKAHASSFRNTGWLQLIAAGVLLSLALGAFCIISGFGQQESFNEYSARSDSFMSNTTETLSKVVTKKDLADFKKDVRKEIADGFKSLKAEPVSVTRQAKPVKQQLKKRKTKRVTRAVVLRKKKPVVFKAPVLASFVPVVNTAKTACEARVHRRANRGWYYKWVDGGCMPLIDYKRSTLEGNDPSNPGNPGDPNDGNRGETNGQSTGEGRSESNAQGT